MPVAVMVSDCRASLDLVTIHGVQPERVRAFRTLPVEDAAWRAFEREESAALVGGTLARRYGWKVGEQVTLPRMQGIAFTVRGIIPEAGGATDSIIYLKLSFLQIAAGEQGVCNQVWLKVADSDAAAATAEAVDSTLSARGVRTLTRVEGTFLRDTTADIRRMVEMLQVPQIERLLGPEVRLQVFR